MVRGLFLWAKIGAQGGRRIGEDRLGCHRGIGFAIMDHHHLIRKTCGIGGVVGDHENGRSGLGRQIGDQRKKAGLQGWAKGREGLIEQQNRAGLQQHPAQGRAALLSARQVSGLAGLHARKTKPFKYLRNADVVGLGQFQP